LVLLKVKLFCTTYEYYKLPKKEHGYCRKKILNQGPGPSFCPVLRDNQREMGRPSDDHVSSI
jgi:hypothetical protein